MATDQSASEPKTTDDQGAALSPEEGRHPGWWVPTLYLAEGLPFYAVNFVSVFMYSDLGLSRTQIALLTSAVAIPWSLKPLWSPFMEMFKTKKYFVLLTQFFAAIAFASLAFCIPLDNVRVEAGEQVRYTLAFLWLLAFNASTHDIAADGVYISALSAKRQAQFVGLQGAFFNAGKILSQGGLLVLAGKLSENFSKVTSWMVVMGLIGAIMGLIGLYHWATLPSGGEARKTESLAAAYATFFDVLRAFMRKRSVLWAMAFVVLYRTSEGQMTRIVPLLLKEPLTSGGLGLDLEYIGWLQGTLGAFAFIGGSIAGGLFASTRSLRKALLPLCCMFNIPNAVYALLAYTQTGSKILIGACLFAENFGYGFGFVGVTLFMMQQIAPGPYKMAHYAFATSLMNIGLFVPGMLSGLLADLMGFKMFFLWIMIATLPSFYVAWRVPLKGEKDFEAEQSEHDQKHTYERRPLLGGIALLGALISGYLALHYGVDAQLRFGPEAKPAFLGAMIPCVVLATFAVWWLRTPYVTVREERVRMNFSPFRSEEVPVSEISSAESRGGRAVFQLSQGGTIEVPLNVVDFRSRAAFQAFVTSFAKAA